MPRRQSINRSETRNELSSSQNSLAERIAEIKARIVCFMNEDDVKKVVDVVSERPLWLGANGDRIANLLKLEYGFNERLAIDASLVIEQTDPVSAVKLVNNSESSEHYNDSHGGSKPKSKVSEEYESVCYEEPTSKIPKVQILANNITAQMKDENYAFGAASKHHEENEDDDDEIHMITNPSANEISGQNKQKELHLPRKPNARVSGFGKEETSKRACRKSAETFYGKKNDVQMTTAQALSPSSQGQGRRVSGTPNSADQNFSFQAVVTGFNKNLEENTIRSLLTILFRECGVVNVKFPKDGDSGNLKGIAIIDFSNKSGLSKAIQYNGSNFFGSSLGVHEVYAFESPGSARDGCRGKQAHAPQGHGKGAPGYAEVIRSLGRK